MQVVLLVIWLLYLVFMLVLIWGWHKIPLAQKQVSSSSGVSVVIPFRDEAEHLARLVESLSAQTHTNFEVLFVNDHSTDGGDGFLQQLLKSVPFPFRIITLGEVSGKKAALKAGIDSAQNGLIVTTDADCWFGAGWLASMAQAFENAHIQLVVGPVTITQNASFFSKWQSMEFSALIGTGAATIYYGKPTMANGANLAFRKSAFNEVGGYSGNEHVPGGDDEFLVSKISSRYSSGICFLKSTAAVVSTSPLESLRDYVRQRRRWASKWKLGKRAVTVLLALFIFLFHLTFLFTFVQTFWGDFPLQHFLGLFMMRFALEGFFIKKVRSLQNMPTSLQMVFLSQFLYPLFAVFFGLYANFGNFEWKGRIYKA